jgi:hypothetical protein
MSDQLHAPADLPWGKEYRLPGRLGGPRVGLDAAVKTTTPVPVENLTLGRPARQKESILPLFCHGNPASWDNGLNVSKGDSLLRTIADCFDVTCYWTEM